MLDFTETLVQVCYANVVVTTPSPSMVLLGDAQTTASMVEDPEYLVPSFQKSTSSQLLECPKTDILALVEEHQDLFQTNPCLTDLACHFIPTTGNPVRLQLQCVPAQYREDINRQLEKIVNSTGHHHRKQQSLDGTCSFFVRRKNKRTPYMCGLQRTEHANLRRCIATATTT